jgi:4-amino-4-deoxy-L-arabinose transferase-like glycosyltransferase
MPPIATPKEKAPWLVAAAFAVAAIMLFFQLGGMPLTQPDEGRNAEVGREMARSHSFTEATLEGMPYLDKPVTYFACVAASLRLLGDTEGAARLPAALFALAALVLLFVVVRRHAGETAASFAVIVVATSPMFFTFARIVIMDMMLAACTVLAVLAAFEAEQRSGPARRLLHALAAAGAGAGFIVKGPVGLLVPAAVLVAYFLVARNASALKRLFWPWNALVFLAFAAPWFISVVHAHPDFLRYGVVEETLGRFFTPSFNRTEPFWYFGPVVLAGLAPWSLLLFPLAYLAWRRGTTLRPLERLLLVWAVVDVAFFSLSRTKQPGYVLAGIVAAGGLIGLGLARAWERSDGAAARSVARWSGGFAGVAAVAGAVLLAAWISPRTMPIGPAPSSPDAAWVAAAVPGLAAGCLIASLCGAMAFLRASVGWAVPAFAALPLAIVTLAYPGLAVYAEGRSARPLAEALQALPQDTEIVCLAGYAPGLSFYLGRTITLISDDGSQLGSNYVVSWLKRTDPRPATIIAWDGRKSFIASRDKPAYVLARGWASTDLAALARPRGGSPARLPGGWTGFLFAPLPRP